MNNFILYWVPISEELQNKKETILSCIIDKKLVLFWECEQIKNVAMCEDIKESDIFVTRLEGCICCFGEADN